MNHPKNCQCLTCDRRRAEDHLSDLRRLHGSYSSESDRLWHTIGELDWMIELELPEAESKKLVKPQSREYPSEQ
jgi:hypothetical protein